MILQIALLCTVSGVRDITGIDAEGGDNGAISFGFKGGGEGFELDRVV